MSGVPRLLLDAGAGSAWRSCETSVAATRIPGVPLRASVRHPRRALLSSGLRLSGALVLGCSSQPLPHTSGEAVGTGGAGDIGESPFAGGTQLSLVPFVG